MRDFAHLYPCGACAASLRAIVDERPPDAAARGGKGAFARWMCEVHNEVNRELGKDVFDCGEESLGRRWGECEACAVHAEELDEFTELAGLRGIKQFSDSAGGIGR